MNNFFRSGVILAVGIVLLALAGAMHAILLESHLWIYLIGAAGLALAGWSAYQLRDELAALVRQRRGEIVLYTLGIVGVLCAAGYLSTQFSWRMDMTEEGRYSLSPQTVTMLKRLQKPVHITFFHDPLMRETVELYELMGRQTDKLTLEFFDPMLNPAAARLRGVQFAGTAILESEDRKMQINGPTETEIANAILRVSLGVTQKVCFLEGHREPDPFSLETHDHLEGTAGHTHGLGSVYETHQQHGMAKARKALETLNYTVEKISLARAGAAADLRNCSLLVVAGPQVALLPQEVAAIGDYLAGGGNGLFMLEPFVQSGIEPLLRDYGIVADNDIIIDESSHFWADPSAPAVSDYNYHPVAEDLPLSFFPGARSFSPTAQRMAGAEVLPLANSSKQSYGLTDKQHTRFDKDKDLAGPLTIFAISSRRPLAENDAFVNEMPKVKGNGAGTDKAKPAIAARARSRIAVIGDSDFATNSFFHIMGNGKLFLNAVNYLASKENLIGLEPRSRDLPRVNLTNRQMKGTFFLAVILVPALLAAIGFAVWWRQR